MASLTILDKDLRGLGTRSVRTPRPHNLFGHWTAIKNVQAGSFLKSRAEAIAFLAVLG
jgi:hypothetical protein